MFSKQEKKNKILLEQFIKSYEIYYGENSAIGLINDIMKEKVVDFLPEQLQQISSRKLKRTLSNIIKTDWNKAKDSPEYDLNSLSKHIHVKVSKKRIVCASLISAITLSLSIGVIGNLRKTNQNQQISIKSLELYDEATAQNIKKYTLSKKENDGTMKFEGSINKNTQEENHTTEFNPSLKTKTIAETSDEYHTNNERKLENDNLEELDEFTKLVDKKEEPVEQMISANTTNEILKLFNRELSSRKITEKDLEIISQIDSDLMVIKSEDKNYNQITKDYIVTTEEDGTIKIVHGINTIEKDLLTNQKINRIPNLVDYMTVSEFIKKNGIENSDYKLSKNTFLGYKNIQEIDDLYGIEVVDCIQKYGLPIPVYQAKDFKQDTSKNTSYQKK